MDRPDLLPQEFEEKKLYALHPLTGKNPVNKTPIIGFDVETEHVPDDFNRVSGRPVKCWRQDFVLGAVVWEDHEKVFRDRDTMAEFLLTRQFRDSLILATNLEFDMGILYPNIHERFKIIYRHCLKGAIHEEKTERQNTGHGYHKRRQCIFGDTRNYLPASVDALGKIVGVPKMDHPSTMRFHNEALGILAHRPQTEEEWNDLASYCVNDAKITQLFGKAFQTFCTEQKMKMKLTLAGCGIDFWRRNYQHDVMIREPRRYLVKHFQGSFRGGMTVMYKRGTVPDKIYAYDLNSAYSFSMSIGTDGKGAYPHPSSFCYKEKLSVEHVERYDGITHAQVDMPYMYCPPLGIKNSTGKLLFPVGRFSGWFTNIELRAAMNVGAEITPGEGIFYRQSWVPFKDAAEHLYALRMQYGKNHYQYPMVKILMNSGLFGRWGMNFLKMEDIFSAADLDFDAQGVAWKTTGHKRERIDSYIMRNVVNAADVCIVEKEGMPMKTSFPILSEYTTAICRLHLWQKIMRYDRELVYSDTDSAFMTNPVFENDDTTLGAMKLEKESGDAVIAALKMYRIEDKCKSKGVGKYLAEKPAFDSALKSQNVDMIQWLRMKSAWAQGKSPGSIILTRKHLKLDDTKREWNGQRFVAEEWQDSQPLVLNE